MSGNTSSGLGGGGDALGGRDTLGGRDALSDSLSRCRNAVGNRVSLSLGSGNRANSCADSDSLGSHHSGARSGGAVGDVGSAASNGINPSSVEGGCSLEHSGLEGSRGDDIDRLAAVSRNILGRCLGSTRDLLGSVRLRRGG